MSELEKRLRELAAQATALIHRTWTTETDVYEWFCEAARIGTEIEREAIAAAVVTGDIGDFEYDSEGGVDNSETRRAFAEMIRARGDKP